MKIHTKQRILNLKKELQEVFDRYPDLVGVNWYDGVYIMDRVRKDGAVNKDATKIDMSTASQDAVERIVFEKGEGWVQEVEGDPMSSKEFNQGQLARLLGLEITDNPYYHKSESDEHKDWDLGWTLKDEEIQQARQHLAELEEEVYVPHTPPFEEE